MTLSCQAPCTCHIPSGDPFCVKPAAAQILCSGISANAFRSHLGWIEISDQIPIRDKEISIDTYNKWYLQSISHHILNRYLINTWKIAQINTHQVTLIGWFILQFTYVSPVYLVSFLITPATPISGTSLPALSPHHSVGHWDAAGVPVPKGSLKKQSIKVMCCCYPPGN